MQVQESDMHRVAVATGAQTQTTVNNLNPKVLGSVEAFEEKQVRTLPESAVLMCHFSASLALWVLPMHLYAQRHRTIMLRVTLFSLGCVRPLFVLKVEFSVIMFR